MKLRGWQLGLLLMGIAVLLAAVGGGVWSWQFARSYSRAQSSLASLKALAQEPRLLLQDPAALEKAEGELVLLSAELQRLQGMVGLLRRARPLVERLPRLGSDLALAPQMLETAMEVTRAAQHLVKGLTPVTDALSQPPEDLQGLAELQATLEAVRPELQAALDSLDRARLLWAGLEAARLSPRSRSYLEDLDVAMSRLRDVAGLGLRAPQLISALREAASQLETLRQLPSSPGQILQGGFTVSGYQATLAQAEATLLRLSAELALAESEQALFTALPGIGDDLKALPVILRSALTLVRATQTALQGTESVLQATSQGLLGPNGGGHLQMALEGSREGFARAQAMLAEGPDPEALSTGNLTPLSRNLLAEMAQARRLLSQALAVAPDYLGIAEEVLGFQGVRTYLVLGLDEDELRANGGFIGSVWEVTVEQGAITQLRFMYSPDVDDKPHWYTYPPPPEPMFKYMWAGYWFFRDAAWYADFPTTVQVVQNLYQKGQGYRVDGVVAVVQGAMAGVVGALGPLEVPGTGQVLTGENLKELMFRGVPPPPGANSRYPQPRVWLSQVLGDLVLERVQGGLTLEELQRLASALLASLQQRQVLLYSADPGIQGLLHRNSWDGRLLSPEGDYLQVVDSNLYADKVNATMSQTLDYRVTLDNGGGARGKVIVKYSNPSPAQSSPCAQAQSLYEDSRQGCYWNYLRVYVPGQAEVAEGPLLPLPPGSLYYRAGFREANTFTARHSEGDKLVMAGFFVVPPAQEMAVSMEYLLPGGLLVEEAGGVRRYRLLVQKQAGTGDIPLRVTVEFPIIWRVLDVQAPQYILAAGTLTFDVLLDTDKEFSIVFQKDEG